MGQTTNAETEQVLQWKKMHPAIAQELDAIENSLEMYAQSKAIVPALNTKQLIMQQVAATKVTETPVVNISTSNKWKWLAAASTVLFLLATITSILFLSQKNKTQSALAALQQKVNKIDTVNNNLQQDLNAVLTSNSQPIVLQGTPKFPASTAKIFWIKNTGDVYVAPSGLPDAPNNLQYQLWALIDGKPVNAGMIIKDKSNNKYSIQKMQSFNKVDAFAITLEPKGGSENPTMENMYVMAKT
jgi:anti-sigma-K factor RskA